MIVAGLMIRHLNSILLVSLVLFSCFSGCFGNEEEEIIEIENEESWRSYSVVSPIDTGINVYHDHFRTNETYPQEILDGLGVNKWCNLTFEGSYSERVEADMDTCWSNLTATDIVYFPGTKIIGTSPDGYEESDILILDDPQDGHGTAVTGAVLNANPDAVIFFVEGFSDNAVLAAANQPLVDVLTTSFGPIASVPVPAA